MRAIEEQIKLGSYFIFEHPLNASSWREHSVLRVASLEGVGTTVIDQCAYGLRSVDNIGEAPARTSTRLLSNLPTLLTKQTSDAKVVSDTSYFSRVEQKMPRTIQPVFVVPL